MKRILLAVLLFAPLSLFAQNPKFAHFNYTEIMQALPATKAAQSELEALYNRYSTEIQDMQKEFQTKQEKYSKEAQDAQAAGHPLPENMQKRYADELQDMYQKIQQAAEDNEKAYNEAQQQKMMPIIQKVMDAVNQVAKEGGYVYVIDSNAAQTNGIVVNTELSEDVTAKVKAKVGL